MKKINNLKKHQDDWFEENSPFGIELGYPKCCIKEFCDQPPILLEHSKRTKDDMRRYKAACINGNFTGFIPCKIHAKEITTGKIKLEDLIENRNTEFPPFPNF